MINFCFERDWKISLVRLFEKPALFNYSAGFFYLTLWREDIGFLKKLFIIKL